MGYQILEKNVSQFSCSLGMGANQNEKKLQSCSTLIQREQCYVHSNVILFMEFYSHRFQE